MAVEVTPNEFIDLGLASCVEVLKFMDGLKFDNVEAVWKHTIGFTFKQMFAFIGSDV